MPCETSWEPLGVVFRFSGIVVDEEFIAATEELYASPLLPTMKYHILDYSLVEKVGYSDAIWRRTADWDRIASETNPDMKVAVITSDPLVRGMTNVYAATHEARGGSWTTQLFEREEDARAWAARSN